MNESILSALVGGLIIAFLAQAALVWRAIGKLEVAVKQKACPFGDCPVYQRAKTEAVEPRHIGI